MTICINVIIKNHGIVKILLFLLSKPLLEKDNNDRVSEGEIRGVADVLCVNALTGVAFFYEAPSKVQATDALERWEIYPLTERGHHQTGVPIS